MNEKELDNTKLEINMVIKNYNEMCKLLNEENRTGKSKQLQLRNWERYFSYEKQGNNFIITEIYNTPLPNVDGRDKGNNAIYIKYIERILLELLSKQEDKLIVCTKNNLLITLGMVNLKYADIFIRKSLVADNIFTSKDIHDFDSRAYEMLNRTLFSALNSLQNRFLLNWRQELHYTITDKESGIIENRIATDDQVIVYTDCKYKIAKQLGENEGKPEKYDKLRDIYFYNKSDEFYRMLDSKVKQVFGWDSTCIKYRLIYQKDNVIDAIPKTEKQLEVLKQKSELNGKIIEALNKNAEIKYKNMLKKYDATYDELCEMYLENKDLSIEGKKRKMYKPKDDYVEIQHQIAEELIRLR